MPRKPALTALLLILAILLTIALLVDWQGGGQPAWPREARPPREGTSGAPGGSRTPRGPSRPQPGEMRRTPDSESELVTLHVIDALSGDGLPQATVEVAGGHATAAGATEPGVFHVHRRERGVLRARAEHAGYLPATSFLVRESETLALHRIPDLVVAVRRHGTGEPVDGAEVEVRGANGAALWHDRTAAGVASCPGRVLFENAEEELHVHAAEPELGRADVALRSGTLANGIATLYLVPTIDLRVEITSSHGVPVPGATVRCVLDERSWRLGRPSRTDADGLCRVAGAPAHAVHRGYWLLTEAEGFASRLVSGPIPADRTVRIRLGPAAEPCGVRLLDPRGAPLTGVAVHLTPSTWLALPGITTPLTATTRSGAEGLALFDVPDGEDLYYDVTVPGDAGRPSVTARYSRTRLAAIPTVQLREGMVCRVRVTDRHGSGLGGAAVYVVPHGKADRAGRRDEASALVPAWTQVAGKTDRDGHATLTLLDDRRYACVCWAPGFAPAAQALVPDADTATVRLERLERLSVHGTDAGGRGVPGIAVSSQVAWHLGRERVPLPPALRQRVEQITYTGPDGTTSILARPGQSVAPVRRELGSPVRIGEAHVREGRVELRIHPRQEAVLWVVDADGDPFPGVSVSPRVDGRSQGPNDTGVAGADGRAVVRVPAAPAGTAVRLTLAGAGTGSARMDLGELLSGQARVVAARRQGRVVGVRFPAEADGVVDAYRYRVERRSPQVRISGGVAVPGERIELELPDQREHDLVIGGDQGPPVRVALPADHGETLLLSLPVTRSVRIVNRCRTWEQIGVWEPGTRNQWRSRAIAPHTEVQLRLPDDGRDYLVSDQRVLGRVSRDDVQIGPGTSAVFVLPDHLEVR